MLEGLFTSLPMIACALCATLICIKLLRNHGIDDRPSRLLMAWLLVTAVLYWGHWIFFGRAMGAVPGAVVVYSAANLAVYPMFLLYVVSLTTPGNRVSWRWWWVLAPAVVLLVAASALMLAMAPGEATTFATTFPYDNDLGACGGLARALAIAIITGKLVFPLTVVGVVVTAYRRMHRFESRVANYYSDIEGRNVRPLRDLTIAMAVIAVASIVVGVLGRQVFADTQWPLYAVSVVFTILLLAIVNEGYTLAPDLGRDDFDGDLADEAPPASPSDVAADGDTAAKPLVADDHDALWLRIEALMEQENVYLQPDLKIADLVSRLGSNRHYVYEAIKLGTGGLSFSDLVNRYRINHAVTLLESQPELSIAEVATMSGYNSITSFYRNFKRNMGCLPSEMTLTHNG